MQHGLQIISGDKVVNLEDWGFDIDSIRIITPEQENIFAEIEGVSGRSLQSAVHKFTQIEVDVTYNYDFELDFPLLRDKLQAMVSSTSPFYIREKRAKEYKVEFEVPGQKTGAMQTSGTALATGKRYKVLRSGTMSFEEAALHGSGTITFETVGTAYAESVGTSMDIQRNGISYESGLWSYGMGLQKDPSTWKYSFTNTAPRFYNPSDVDLDDFKMDKVITIRCNSGGSYIRIVDNSGNAFRIDRAINSGDVLTIDKQYIKINGTNVLKDVTSLYFPIIFKGWNTFTIEGINSYTVDLDFRFYYGGGFNWADVK